MRFREAFEQQRTNITRVFEAKSPKVIACLGAGVLNNNRSPTVTNCTFSGNVAFFGQEPLAAAPIAL